jgi:hypothetical protein
MHGAYKKSSIIQTFSQHNASSPHLIKKAISRMQLLLSAGITLLAIVPALCWPMDDYRYPGMQQRAMFQNTMDQRGNGWNAFGQYDPYYSAVDQATQEDQPLPKDVADELRKQIESEGGNSQQVEVQATSSGRVLDHGSTAALQMLQNNHWFTCFGSLCTSTTCPGRFFDGDDWIHCWGAVYRIVRPRGAGHILTGDFVGLYFPRGSNWFSASNGGGHRANCPGTFNEEYGFESLEKWFECGGEVFQVFAKGKGYGETITDQDTLSFYYTVDRTYVQFLTDTVVTSQCMLEKSGNKRPPSDEAFDKCLSDSVEITIAD